MRHCAFCLKEIEGEAIKLCGKCRKRAYCSRECQITDWSKEGQIHKHWCHLNCGEEDIDWKVCPVAGKGLGLVAMRALPAFYRIMVDGCCDKADHPGIKDLMPVDGNYTEKLVLNCVQISSTDLDLFLRISRANHDCRPNAEHWFDESFKAVVLFAQKDIAEGEEITINYLAFDEMSCDASASYIRSKLQSKWRIMCSKDCSCYDKPMETLRARSNELHDKLVILVSQGKSQEALELVKELVDHHETLGSSLLNKKRTLFAAFQVAVMRETTLSAARKYLEEVYAILSAILSPESREIKDFKRLMDDITTHRNYLIHK